MEKHLREVHPDVEMIECAECHACLNKSLFSKHYNMHGIGLYQCLYCTFSTNNNNDLHVHVSDFHPEGHNFACARVRRQDQTIVSVYITFPTLSSSGDSKCINPPINLSLQLNENHIDATAITKLSAGISKDKIEYHYLDYTEEQLNYMDPSLLAWEQNAEEPPIEDIVKEEVIMDDVAAQTPPNVQNTSTRPRRSCTLEQPSTSAAKSAVQPQADTVPETISVISSPGKMYAISEKAGATFQLEVDAAAALLLNGTGLEGNDLFRCGYDGCTYSANDAKIFNVHIVSQHSNTVKYKCFHCKKTFETAVQLKYHIKEHGKHRFFCYYCDHTTPLQLMMKMHFSELHKRNKTELYALNPTKVDPKQHLFVTYPSGIKENNDYGMKLIARMHEMRSTKKYYTPDEIELLPQQMIYSENVHCKLCDFKSKVRTNMLRHLSMNECSRNRAVPLNPTPSHETGKKHFDQMTNLASGSNTENATSATNIESVCQFVPEDRRFVCGGNSCQYKTHNEEMLRIHLNALHDTDHSYSCPHCNKSLCLDLPISIDEIIYHMRLHDAKIFKCPKCNFCNAIKITVDRHIIDMHPKCKDKPVFVFNSQSNAGQVDSKKSGKTNIVKWKCLICKTLLNLKSHMQQHITETHRLTCKYQCNLCAFQTDNLKDFPDHFLKLHSEHQISFKSNYDRVEVSDDADVTPLWRRDDPTRVG